MAVAGYVVELAFGGLGLIPDQHAAKLPTEGVSWNYTSWLNIVFLVLAAALLVRFLATGGRQMLAMMGGAPDDHADHSGHAGQNDHSGHEHSDPEYPGHEEHTHHGPP
jgi:uncharacterized membrane protein YraQ (UPF0718 family)